MSHRFQLEDAGMAYVKEPWGPEGKPAEAWDDFGPDISRAESNRMGKLCEIAYERIYGDRSKEVHLIGTKTPGIYRFSPERWLYVIGWGFDKHVFGVVSGNDVTFEGWEYHYAIEHQATLQANGWHHLDLALPWLHSLTEFKNVRKSNGGQKDGQS